MNKTDLSKYTKEELIYYLTTIQMYIPKNKTSTIRYSILSKRHQDISKEIADVLADTTIAIEQLNENRTVDQLILVKQLNEKYTRLSNKQRKIEKELWGWF